jgi:hypothetical protein
MATAQQIQELQNIVGQINGLNRETLIKRDKWGEITFEKSKGEFSQVFWFSDQIKSYPLDALPETIVVTMVRYLGEVWSRLKAIDSFSINQGNAAATSTQLSQDLRNSVDQLFVNCAQWIPFLAHQNGDVVRNINALVERTKEAGQILEKSRAQCAEKQDEVQKIVQAARDASAGAGAAVFTKDFEEESVKLASDARNWLIATVIMIAVTVSLAAIFWALTEVGLDQGQVFQKLTTKVFALALMLSGTLWCGKCYKALTHLVIVNRHRALSLRTLQAFSNAAADAQTKDAVLLEATRSIFGNVPTGYVEGAATDNDHKVVEIVRSVMPKS